MDTRILQATTLARMGLDDDQIAQVLRIKEVAKVDAPAPAPAVDAAPLFASARRPRSSPTSATPRLVEWTTLLHAIRARLGAGANIVCDMRALSKKCPDELRAAMLTRKSIKGLGVTVARAARMGKVLCGMRFTALGFERRPCGRGTGTYAIYRVEVV